jgi:hypothetical protein
LYSVASAVAWPVGRTFAADAKLGPVSDAGEQRFPGPRALILRRVLASAASLVAAAVFVYLLRHERLRGLQWLAPIALMGAPVLAAAAIWIRRVALQLLARGIWWSLLLLGGLIAFVAGTTGAGVAFGCHLALASAVSLLAAGATGLDEDGGRFRPVAFRGTLMLALVLAIADTATLVWFGLAQAVDERIFRALWLVPPMVAGVVGLLRMRTWGLLLSLTCNLLVAVLASTRVLIFPYQLRWLLVATAIVQLLIPIPIWVSIARGRLPPPDRWRRAKRIASAAVIAGIAVVSVYFTYFSERADLFSR